IVVDDTGNGNGIQQEVNEENNTFLLNVTLLDALGEPQLTDQVACSDVNTATFNLMNSVITVNPNYNVSFHSSLLNAQNNTSAFTNFTNYVGPSGTVYVRVQDPTTLFYVMYDIELTVNEKPDLTDVPDYNICINGAGQSTVFDLTSKQDEILQGQNATITDYTSQQNADNNIGA